MADDRSASNADAADKTDRMVIFQGAEAPSLADADMSTGRSHVAGEPIDDFFSQAILADFSSTVPFRQARPDGFSLVRLDLPPGAILPRHSHSSDCLYYVESGRIEMGARVLGPGSFSQAAKASSRFRYSVISPFFFSIVWVR